MDRNLRTKAAMKKLTNQLLKLSSTGCVTIFITVVALIIMELILSPIVHSKSWLNRPLTSLNIADEYYVVPPSYTNATWFEDYRQEFKAAVTFDWQPYLYWNTKPFSGKYINVSEARARKTWSSPKIVDTQNKKKKIFMFGGSTMWGWGARDDYTIPSLVSRRLSEEYDTNAEITNFGEVGFVSTQEVLRLIFEIQKGNIPDIVVFYNGLNDVYSALRPGQIGVAGVVCDEFQRKKLFEGKYPVFSWIYENYIIQSGMFKAILRLLNKDKTNPVVLDPKQIETISEDITRVYQKNLNLIQALSKKYNFDVLCYWQPTIFSKKNLSDFEKELEKVAQTELFNKAVFKRVSEKVKKIEHNTFHDISNILEMKTTYYIDFSHIDEKGNDVIATRIARDLANQVRH